jgi:hypothetical protein
MGRKKPIKRRAKGSIEQCTKMQFLYGIEEE